MENVHKKLTFLSFFFFFVKHEHFKRKLYKRKLLNQKVFDSNNITAETSPSVS